MIDWILKNPTDALLAVLATTTAIAMAIRVAIPALSAIAAHTATKADDEAVTRLASWVDWTIVALDAVRRVLPRVVIGPLPSNQPIATSMRPARPAKPLSAPPPAGDTLTIPAALGTPYQAPPAGPEQNP
jgi:hypothetical protein